MLASTLSGINTSTQVGIENGDVTVPCYDWVTFLKPHFKKVAGIKANHHFHFSTEQPGVVTMQLYCGSPATKLQLSVSGCPSDMPPELRPKGMDAKRQKYLYDEIREFCREETKDIVCPNPESMSKVDVTMAAVANTDGADSNVIERAAVSDIQKVNNDRRKGVVFDSDSEPISAKRGRCVRGRSRRNYGRGRIERGEAGGADNSDSDYEPITAKRGRGGRGRGRGKGCGRGRK